ncbi:hypothetical protein Tco_0278875, partial [Tanacetum coccineum]
MDENANPATTQGEHSNVEENVAIPDASQREHKSDNAMFKIITPIPNLPSPTPLCSFPPDHMMKHVPQQESVQEFTDKLFQTTSSSFSPALLKEPSPPRDPAKGKGVDMEEPVNILVPFMDKGGSNPKMPSLKPFVNIEGVLTQEEFIEQLAKIKRLADL